MKPLTCLIIDDEPVARKILFEFIAEVDFLSLTGEASNPVEANNFLQSHPVDLIFLDIEMPRMTGIDLLRNMSQPVLTIITTAYPQYAVEGFNLDVIDYLLKPIAIERFLKAVSKAKELYEFKTQNLRATSEYFFIKCDQRLEKIMIKDLLYIEGLGNYIIIYTRQQKFISYLTLKAFEENLSLGHLIRVHKSYLVAISAVRQLEGNELVMENNTRLPISKSYKDSVMLRISAFLIRR